MVSESARTLDLLRQRDRQKRTRQVWIGVLVVWGVVVGWLAFLGVRSLAGESGPGAAWLAYLVPLVAFGIVVLVHSRRLRVIDAELLSEAEADQRR